MEGGCHHYLQMDLKVAAQVWEPVVAAQVSELAAVEVWVMVAVEVWVMAAVEVWVTAAEALGLVVELAVVPVAV